MRNRKLKKSGDGKPGNFTLTKRVSLILIARQNKLKVFDELW